MYPSRKNEIDTHPRRVYTNSFPRLCHLCIYTSMHRGCIPSPKNPWMQGRQGSNAQKYTCRFSLRP